MALIDTAIMMVENHDKFQWKKGYDAEFCQIDGKWGVKIFREDAQIRDKTFELQTLAWIEGLAPEIREKFQAVDPKGYTCYGYLTECVEYVCDDYILASYGYSGMDDPELSISDACEWESDFDCDVKTRDLCEAIEKLGITAMDLHWGNVGMLRGRYVAFDFSREESS